MLSGLIYISREISVSFRECYYASDAFTSIPALFIERLFIGQVEADAYKLRRLTTWRVSKIPRYFSRAALCIDIISFEQLESTGRQRQPGRYLGILILRRFYFVAVLDSAMKRWLESQKSLDDADWVYYCIAPYGAREMSPSLLIAWFRRLLMPRVAHDGWFSIGSTSDFHSFFWYFVAAQHGIFWCFIDMAYRHILDLYMFLSLKLFITPYFAFDAISPLSSNAPAAPCRSGNAVTFRILRNARKI